MGHPVTIRRYAEQSAQLMVDATHINCGDLSFIEVRANQLPNPGK